MATVPELSWFEDRATALQELNTKRNKMFDKIDEMDSRTWNLPDQLTKIKWVMKVTESIFTQAMKSATRMLSGKKPRFIVTPVHPGIEESTDLADRLEKALEWIMDRAGRRRPATIVEDVALSAVKYAEVCAQVTFLPVQIKAVEKAKGTANRLRAMLRHSDFLIDLYDPRDVFPRYSTAGLEEVILVTTEDPQQLVDLYGAKAKGFKQYIDILKASGTEIPTVTKYDYVSWENRAVWAEAEGGEKFELVREAWKWPFLPWVCRIGGTSLEEDEERKRRPLLYDAYTGEEWEIANRVITLRYSDMLRYAMSPKRVYRSDTEGQPEIDESSPDLATKIASDEAYETLQPVPPDTNMAILHQEIRASNERSTLSSILMGGEVPGQAAFATVNLVTHSALAAMRPIQILCQNSLADIGELCFLWVKYSNIKTMAYGRNEQGQGEEYLVSPEDIDADNLYISVELETDVPTDKQSRAVTAGALIDRGIISRRTAMEDIGVRNSAEEEDAIYMQQLGDAYLAASIENVRTMESMATRQAMEQQITQQIMQQIGPMLQQLQQQQGQQGQQQGQPQPGGQVQMGQPGNMPPQQGMPETGIPTEANPAAGGPVPAQFAPGATREGQTGQAPGGADMA